MNETSLFDLTGWTQIEITGSARQNHLHGFCTNDIKRMQPGDHCEAFITTIKGRILGHVLVFALPDSLRMIAVPGAAAAIIPHLQKYLLGADAEIVDRSAELGLAVLTGPDAAQRAGAAAAAVNELLIAETDLVPPPSRLISGPKAHVDAAVAVMGLTFGSAARYEQLRIESGFPWHGRDFSEDHLAQEAARTERAISFRKGCYLGQEPIARLDALGHTNKELRGLVIEAGDVAPGAAIFAGETQIGTLTSVADRGNGTSVGLAMVRTQAGVPGAKVSVQHPEGFVPATLFWPRLETEI
ncbi:CAF17-like 4Fe-4S cluster assembly/insertion protein YgfZ [Planctomicrobium sp. SH664]|uniref:CAF17-like 4Fe-4S cluster assembly/insertion protein YgfZ n=1 Tax=Planctomicrobium sp. SH664 TaxID=3448125 RepID=UPI003F5B7460